MSGYTKLFSSILASTVWSEPTEVRIVWITLLAMAGKNGVAEGSIPGLAIFARLPVEVTRKALERLQQPDEDSRSKEHEGRRIAEVDGGWLVLNHAKYREKMGADERREYNRIKKSQERDRKKVSTGSQQVSTSVIDSQHCQHKAEAEAEAEASPEAKISQLENKPIRKVVAASGSQSAGASASKRPIFSGQRLTVFEWMLDDCTNVLGTHTEEFDLHAWFFEIDAEAARAGVVIPKRDSGAWLQSQLVAEAQRRGLPITMATTDTRDQARIQANIAAFQQFVAKGSK